MKLLSGRLKKKKIVMLRAKQICGKTGCNELIDGPGRCEEHKIVDKFKDLERASGSKEFYGSAKWKKTRAKFRQKNPLCCQCKAEGLITKMDIVDHIEERNDLIARGEDPCDPQYLQSLCHPHHNAKLRERRR